MIYITKINNKKIEQQEFDIIVLNNHKFTLKIKNKFGLYFLSTTKNGFKLPIYPFSANQLEIGMGLDINIERINSDREVRSDFEMIEFYDSEKDLHFTLEVYNNSLVLNGNCDSLIFKPDTGNSFYVSLIEG